MNAASAKAGAERVAQPERAESGVVPATRNATPDGFGTMLAAVPPAGVFVPRARLATRDRPTVRIPVEQMRALRASSATAHSEGGRYLIHSPDGAESECAPTRSPRSPVPLRHDTARHDAASAHRRALAFARQGRWNLAADEALRAVQWDGRNARYETSYASILLRAGPPRRESDAQAAAHLRRALKLDPDCAEAHYLLGLLRHRRNAR